ncbi:MAG: hypothetical protein QXQ64_05525 [Candidatus Bathyarchaeia archaeon]
MSSVADCPCKQKNIVLLSNKTKGKYSAFLVRALLCSNMISSHGVCLRWFTTLIEVGAERIRNNEVTSPTKAMLGTRRRGNFYSQVWQDRGNTFDPVAGLKLSRGPWSFFETEHLHRRGFEQISFGRKEEEENGKV